MANIVLIHGWGSSVDKLKPIESELKKLKWNVYVPKLPGFDLEASKYPWKVEDYSEFVYKSAGKKFKNYVVFGHSFGGRIAADLAYKHDEVAELILCSTSGITRGNLLKRYAFGVAAKIGKPLASQRYKKLLYKGAREHDYEKTHGVMKDTFRLIIGFSIKSIISDLDKNILVLWGDKDKMTPLKDAKYIQKQAKKSTLNIYKGQGHTLPYVNAKVLAHDITKWYTQLK